uniref:Protein arginine methyltransferase 9 n=1 Tax=Sinocyclocheilus grahami TaxID=75366 RepID=A0A672KT05_SINGR
SNCSCFTTCIQYILLRQNVASLHGILVISYYLGFFYFRMGFRDEDAGHFYKALKFRPDFPEAKENFYRVANWLGKCWHFLMLSDNGRNHKYQLAIKKAVEGGCSSVLDIGTGMGIMCAKMGGAAEAYACELSKTMYELACEVLSANGMADSIKILHLKSLDMDIPKDIPNSLDLIEKMIFNLFQQLIIKSSQQNTGEPLSNPSQTARVIPAGATVLCASSVGGLDLSAVGQIYSPVRCLADTEDSTEPYTTERLSRLRRGYIQLTQPFTALDIDFNNVQELEGLCSKEVTQLGLSGTQEGVLDALAVWFQLHLDQVNHLSTGPQEDTCWEQAIYPIHSPFSKISWKDSYLRLCCTCSGWPSNQPGDTILSQQSDTELDPIYVLDVSEGFSVLSLMAAQLGFDSSEDKQISPGLVQAYSSVEKEHHQTMLRPLAKGNGVLESALKFWLNHVEDDSALLQKANKNVKVTLMS